MVICCGRLVVVSSIPPGDFFFVFSAKLLFFGAQRRAARDFGGFEKALVGGHAHRLSVVAVWWSLVRFRRAIYFLFLMQICFFSGDNAVRLGILVDSNFFSMGYPS